MGSVMAEPGDIMDELEDDGFRRSLEDADKDGQWKDSTARFEDPKLTQLARQLAEAPRTTYAERRLQELERRAAAKHKKQPPAVPDGLGSSLAPPAEPMAAPFGGEAPAFAEPDTPPEPTSPPTNWRETVVRASPEPSAPELQPMDAATVVAAAGSQVLSWCRALGSAAAVFAAGMAVQAAIAGWAPWWGLRASLAALVTGVLWHHFGEGRFRAAAIGTSAHLIAFVSTGGTTTSQELFAAFAGAMVVLLGSGGVGLMREESLTHHRSAG